jgi:hypothetical protein
MIKNLTLEHKRRLRSTEIIKKGDVYIRYDIYYPDRGKITPAKYSIGKLVHYYEPGGYQFWRRLHTKKPKKGSTTAPASSTAPVTIVQFKYNGTKRLVQLIKMDKSYLKGLDITIGRDQKRRYQFKSFLRSRIYDDPLLAHFGPIDDFKG